MAKGKTPSNSSDSGNIKVTFVGLGEGEAPPEVALYQLDNDGKPAAKLAQVRQGAFSVAAARLQGQVALGPDVANLSELEPERLVRYRAEEIANVWAGQGLVLPKARWDIIFPSFRCVTGRVRKCRPFWWDIVTQVKPVATRGIKYSRALALHDQVISTVQAATLAGGTRYFPWRCVPICEGRVEIFEKQCCCPIIVLPDLIDRIREYLERIPFPWPPIPEPDPPPYRRLQARRPLKAPAGSVSPEFDWAAVPPERLYEAYRDLVRLPPAEAERYAMERDWLYPFICSCTIKKVGEVAIQPGGEFHFCYPRRRPALGCSLTYAYRVKQYFFPFWIRVYDGLAAGAWFSGSEEAELRVVNPKAMPCEDHDYPPPPNSGKPFIMLHHIGAYGTFHHQFPTQTAASKFGSVGGNDGLYSVGSVPDCPWTNLLKLFLFPSSDLQPIASYYRLTIVQVDATGSPTGSPRQLDADISWKWRASNTVFGSDKLGPVNVGSETNLYRIPYKRPAGQGDWDPGQHHQEWNTLEDSDGKYMLILEVFDGAGKKIVPNNGTSPVPANMKPFAFLRWDSAASTSEVLFADCAHILWTDRVPVFGDIEDLRKNGVPNVAQCQYLRGDIDDEFSIGYRAYHVHGVSNSDSFMASHSISWQRGLNGDTGTLAPETSATMDAGEGASAAQSGSATFGAMLNGQQKCTFSVTLEVSPKHWDGVTFVGPVFRETASFALDVGPPVGGP
jgi:hypothetical protein